MRVNPDEACDQGYPRPGPIRTVCISIGSPLISSPSTALRPIVPAPAQLFSRQPSRDPATSALSQGPGMVSGDFCDADHGCGRVFRREERLLMVLGVNEANKADEERKRNSPVHTGGPLRCICVLPRGNTCTPPHTGSRGQNHTCIFRGFESGRGRHGGERKEERGLHKGCRLLYSARAWRVHPLLQKGAEGFLQSLHLTCHPPQFPFHTQLDLVPAQIIKELQERVWYW